MLPMGVQVGGAIVIREPTQVHLGPSKDIEN